MRRRYWAAAVLAAAVSVVSCGGKRGGEQVDSVDTVVTEAQPEVLLETADLAFGDVRGAVSEVVVESFAARKVADGYEPGKKGAESIVYTFSPQGLLTSYKELMNGEVFYNMEITYTDGDRGTARDVLNNVDGTLRRNDKGEITALGVLNNAEYDRDERMIWKDGRLLVIDTKGWEWNWNKKFAYNADGLLEKEETVLSDMECTNHYVRVFTYVKFDDKGNWTERWCRLTGESECSDEETGESVKEKLSPTVEYQKRTITYY